MGAVFVGGAGAAAGPVVVGDDIAEGDAVFVHEEGGEFGGAFDGGGAVIAAVFAHFDADAVVVAGAVEVGVFALFACGEVLDGAVVLDGEVPCEEADAVAAGAFLGAEFAVGESAGVVEGVAGVVLGGVDGDVAGGHGPMEFAAVGAFGDEAGDDADFAAEESFRGDAAGDDWGAGGWRGVALGGTTGGGAGGDESAEQRNDRAEQGQGCGETHAVWVLFRPGKSRYAGGLRREGERSGFWDATVAMEVRDDDGARRARGGRGQLGPAAYLRVR